MIMKKLLASILTVVAMFLASNTLAYSVTEQSPNFWAGQLGKELSKKMNDYIGGKFYGNFIYRGKVIKQLNDVFTMTRKTEIIGHNIYLLPGYRYEEAESQGALIVDRSAHILLAAIAVHVGTHLPQINVFVRDKSNLKYLPEIKKWAASQPEYYKNYQLSIFNLSCTRQNIATCKIQQQ